MGIKFDKDTLAIEQTNYACKIVNIYIVYDLDTCPKNPTNNFKFKNSLFATTSVVEISDKEEYAYSGYVITFDTAGSWSFGHDFDRNVVIFGDFFNNFYFVFYNTIIQMQNTINSLLPI